MKKYLPRALIVVVSLAILAPAFVLWPILGVTDLAIEFVFMVAALLLLRRVTWPAKLALIVLLALFFTFPPVPNYLLVTDRGVSLQWIGFANMLGDRVPILERLLFYAACWLAAAKLSERQAVTAR